MWSSIPSWIRRRTNAGSVVGLVRRKRAALDDGVGAAGRAAGPGAGTCRARSSPAAWILVSGSSAGAGRDDPGLEHRDVAGRRPAPPSTAPRTAPSASAASTRGASAASSAVTRTSTSDAERRREVATGAGGGRAASSPSATRPSRGGPRSSARPGSSRPTRTTVASRSATASSERRDEAVRRDDDDRRRHRRLARRRQRRERQREPGEHEAEAHARDQPDEQQRGALGGQPGQQLAGRHAQRLEEGELAQPLLRGHRRRDEEPDRPRRRARRSTRGPGSRSPRARAGRRRGRPAPRRGRRRPGRRTAAPRRIGGDRPGRARARRRATTRSSVAMRRAAGEPRQVERGAVGDHERLGRRLRREAVDEPEDLQLHGDADHRGARACRRSAPPDLSRNAWLTAAGRPAAGRRHRAGGDQPGSRRAAGCRRPSRTPGRRRVVGLAGRERALLDPRPPRSSIGVSVHVSPVASGLVASPWTVMAPPAIAFGGPRRPGRADVEPDQAQRPAQPRPGRRVRSAGSSSATRPGRPGPPSPRTAPAGRRRRGRAALARIPS